MIVHMAAMAQNNASLGVGIFAMLIVFGPLTYCVMHNRAENDEAFRQCQTKGVAYYKAVGSYPRFSTGEFAESEVAARCTKEPWSFDGTETLK